MWCWKRSKLVLGRISGTNQTWLGSPKHAVSAMKSNSHNGRSTLFQPLISRTQQGLYVLTLIITPELCINNCYLQTGTRVKRGAYRAITILFVCTFLFYLAFPCASSPCTFPASRRTWVYLLHQDGGLRGQCEAMRVEVRVPLDLDDEAERVVPLIEAAALCWPPIQCNPVSGEEQVDTHPKTKKDSFTILPPHSFIRRIDTTD